MAYLRPTLNLRPNTISTLSNLSPAAFRVFAGLQAVKNTRKIGEEPYSVSPKELQGSPNKAQTQKLLVH